MFVKTLLSIGWKNEPIGAWCTPDKHLDTFKLRICECESMNIFDSFKFNPVKIQVAATRGNENRHRQHILKIKVPPPFSWLLSILELGDC